MNEADSKPADAWQPDYTPAIVENVLSPAMCLRAIQVAEELGFEASPVYGHDGAEHMLDHRRSESAYLLMEHYRELYGVITTTVQAINAERFRFDIYGLAPIQVVRYEPGCFFGEHMDIGNLDAAHRKISLIVQLSASEDYEGGEIVLGKDVVPKTIGGGCFFPSWVPHRVNKVTSGMRYSLVTWAKGEYFR